MPWIRTDDAAPHHGKFFRAGCAAYGWWHAGLCYCNRRLTDGFLPVRELSLVFLGLPSEEVSAHIERLVTERALHVAAPGRKIDCPHPWCARFRAREAGYLMHDYPDFQPLKKQVILARRSKARAGRKGGQTRANQYKHPAIARTQVSAEPPTQPNSTQLNSRETTPREALSSAVPALRPHSPHREHARAVLAFLNQKAGRSFRPTEANLRLVEARLKTGVTVEDCRGVIARKVRAWLGDPKMAMYLRPETLFNATKFESYLGERERDADV